MILVTSAAGGVGRPLVRRLKQRGLPVRAFVKNEAQAALARADGATEVVIGDMRATAELQRALKGVGQIYHAAPTQIIDERPIAETLVKTARSGGLEHIVFHSVIHPEIIEIPHHHQKLRVEQYLRESGLPVTILRPSHYMQNYLEVWDLMCAGVLAYPFSPSSPMGVVDVEDVSEAACHVLASPDGHIGKTYDLSGQVLDRHEMARIWSGVLGHQVTAVRLAPNAMKSPLAVAGAVGTVMGALASPKLRSLRYLVKGTRSSWNARGMRSWPDEARDSYERMMGYYDVHGLPPGDMAHLVQLLGRPATTYLTFARREALARRPKHDTRAP